MHIEQNITFQSNGRTLHGVIYYPTDVSDNISFSQVQTKFPTIFFVHGWTGAMESSLQYASALVSLGFACFLFDMRGHGTSVYPDVKLGKVPSKDFLDDVLAAFDYCSKLDMVDPDNISVVGSSFGGYLAALLTSHRKIVNLVLRAPADYPNVTFYKNKPLSTGDKIMKWRQTPCRFDETFALNAVHKFNGKILIIESGNDNRIPHQVIEDYMNAAQDKKKVTHVFMPDAPHSIKEGPFRDKVEEILVKWFGDKTHN